MNILAINTTTRIINVALDYKGRFFSTENDINLNGYEDVVSLIRALLKKANSRLEQIDYFGACIGPGSFTGMRIGLSAMKALAYSTKKPLIGFGSLDLEAHEVKDKFCGLLCIMQDAKRNNVYGAIFDNQNKLCRLSPYLLLDLATILREVKKINKKRKDLYFYGDIVSRHKDEIKKIFPNANFIEFENGDLRGMALISLTKINLKRKSSPFNLLPLYMYPRDCQVRRTLK